MTQVMIPHPRPSLRGLSTPPSRPAAAFGTGSTTGSAESDDDMDRRDSRKATMLCIALLHSLLPHVTGSRLATID